MFFESNWSRRTIGDVDVVFHDGLYHLFHLVLPNHDFIAHAISDNALNWRRVDNAIFIGDPGTWDDLMLWTMHISEDPHHPGHWRMFYTGLSRRDQGKKQRIGLAVSDDLYRWTKVPTNWVDRRGASDPPLVTQATSKLEPTICTRIKSTLDPESHYPLTPDTKYYEESTKEERNWVSFRDPFYFRDKNRGWLLTAARSNTGPLTRRGCVGLMEEVAPNKFESRPPLLAPEHYDDIEVPNLIELDDEYYLIGSLREDAKIRYWHANKLDQPWKNYSDNVLLPTGNYAGRTCRDPHGILLWNFFTADLSDRTVNNLMPPPKRLVRSSNGQLRATTFEGFDKRILGEVQVTTPIPMKTDRIGQVCEVRDDGLRLATENLLQVFVLPEPVEGFRLRARLRLIGSGKCGIVYRINSETHDGYYISLDVRKGIAQLRCWGTGPIGSGENMMQFRSLQSGFWHSTNPSEIQVQVICTGSYHELLINGQIILSLADETFEVGHLGWYVETADLSVDQLAIHHLAPPTQDDQHLAHG